MCVCINGGMYRWWGLGLLGFFFWVVKGGVCGGGVVDRWVAELIFLVVAGERKE